MTKPANADIEVLENDSIQPLSSEVSVIYRAPAILIDTTNHSVTTGENILFKYEGYSVFDGWFTSGNTWGVVDKWGNKSPSQYADVYCYFQLYKNSSLSNSSTDINFVEGEEWSDSGPNTSDAVSLGSDFQLSSSDSSWGIKWGNNSSELEIKDIFEVYEPYIYVPNVSTDGYELYGFMLFNDTNIPDWNSYNTNDYDESKNFVLFINAQNSEQEVSKELSESFQQSGGFSRIYIAPVYRFTNITPSSKTVEIAFELTDGIVVNNLPELVSGDNPDIINNGSTKSDIGKVATLSFSQDGNTPSSSVLVNGDTQEIQIYTEKNFNIVMHDPSGEAYEGKHYERENDYGFLGFILTSQDVTETYTNKNLCNFMPYIPSGMRSTGILYENYNDIKENNDNIKIRGVWINSRPVPVYSHCPNDGIIDYKDETWSSTYTVSISETSTSALIFHYDQNTGDEFYYIGNTVEAFNVDSNSIIDDDSFVLDLQNLSFNEGTNVDHWELWDQNNVMFATSNSPSFNISGNDIKNRSEIYVVPIIDSIATKVIAYTNNTAWDFKLTGLQDYGTISRWTKGTISVRDGDDSLSITTSKNSINVSNIIENNTLNIGLGFGDDNLFDVLVSEYDANFIAVTQPSGSNLFSFEFSETTLDWTTGIFNSNSSSINKCAVSIKKEIKENIKWDKLKRLIVEGKLDEQLSHLYSWNLNIILAGIKFDYDRHGIGADGEEKRTNIEVTQKLDDVVEIEYSDSSEYHEQYTGNGQYNFVVALETVLEDIIIFDYKQYLCGTLLGYVTSKDDDLNTLISNDNSFFLGFVQPADSIMTIYGFDTMQSEKYLINDFYLEEPADPDSDPTKGFILNWYYGGKDVWRYVTADDYTMPNDNSTFQTGNQYVTFRLRNPYDGKVLNFDETAAYGSINTSVATYESQSGDVSTHEQVTFLTIWEQRSIFNALNGKPTFVNECHDYKNDTTLNEIVQLLYSTQNPGALDDHGTFNEKTVEGNWKELYDPYMEFSVLRRNTRKAGRALVDNIDDWFNWYKREETPGFIANSETYNIPGGSPLMFVAPLLNEDYGCCIQSDATQSSKLLGPGESVTIPIVVLYKTYEEEGRDTTKYTIGFDIRNSLYLDPIYYQFTLNAKYSSSILDSVSSQKSSTQTSTKYNVTVR